MGRLADYPRDENGFRDIPVSDRQAMDELINSLPFDEEVAERLCRLLPPVDHSVGDPDAS